MIIECAIWFKRRRILNNSAVSTMVKLKNNHRSCMEIHQARKNFVSLAASANLKRWIIILFLFYKLDYKDYYCYGISSGSAILNNENGKDLRLVLFLSMLIKTFLPHSLSFALESQFVIPLTSFSRAGALCFLLFWFFSVVPNHPDFNPINAKGLKTKDCS